MKKYIITILILFIIIGISIGGYFAYGNFKSNESNSTDTVKEKTISEIEYLSSNVIDIMNSINNITYENYRIINEKVEADDTSSDSKSASGQNNTINSSQIEKNNVLNSINEETDWMSLNSDIQEIYSSWTTIMMDLSSLNVNKENLLKFNQNLDELTNNIKQKQKSQSLISSANLYSLISLYIKDVSGDDEKNTIYSIRSNILYSYAYSETLNWNKVIEYIGVAKQDFANLYNNQISNINKIDTINKIYILINELEQDAKNNTREMFLINYSNLMQELQNV